MKEQFMPSEKESERAKIGFERMAHRLDELWQKDKLSEKEEKEVSLILNNAAIVDEMLQGQVPEEIKKETR